MTSSLSGIVVREETAGDRKHFSLGTVQFHCLVSVFHLLLTARVYKIFYHAFFPFYFPFFF